MASSIDNNSSQDNNAMDAKISRLSDDANAHGEAQ